MPTDATLVKALRGGTGPGRSSCAADACGVAWQHASRRCLGVQARLPCPPTSVPRSEAPKPKPGACSTQQFLPSCAPPALPRPPYRPQTGECVLQAPAEQLAQECAANATCVAFLLKPGGIVDGKPQLSTFGYLKADADPANWILTPTTIMYVEDTPSASSSSGLSTGAIDTPSASSSSGLSTGAIAGIAVGCAAAVAALAAAAWVLVQHRRRATAAGGLHTAKSNASSSIGGGLPEWGTAGSGTDGYNGGGGKQPWAVQPWPMHPSGSPGSSMAASPFAVASAAAVAASAGTTAHSGGSSGANSYLRQAHLPLVGAGAGQAAALLRAGSAPGRGLSVGSTGAPSGSTLPSAAGSGAEVLAELVQHVAAQDARLLTSSGLHSSGSSDLGQWTIDSLPPRLREWLVPPDQIEFVRW